MEVENNVHVALILDFFPIKYCSEILTNMTSSKPGVLLNLLNQTKTVEIVSKLNTDDFGILEKMIDDDINNSAVVIETIVKNKITGLNQQERKEALQNFSLMLSNVDRETLLTVMIEIAKLPETPSTVAYILESMELSPILDVMNYWLEDEYFTDSMDELQLIFSYFSTDLLNDLYTGITNSARLNLYGLLSETMIQTLPEIGEFSVSELSTSLDELELGQSIVLTYVLENVGEKTDNFLIPVKINGETLFTDKGILSPGNSTTIQHTITPSIIGVFAVDVLGELVDYLVNEVQIVVLPLTPADLVITGFQLVPRQIFSGEMVSVFVSVENMGEEGGGITVPLKIDSALIDSKNVFLPGGQSTTVIFDVSMDYEMGQHVVLVGGQIESFEVLVESQQSGFPWFTAVTVLFVITVGVYYAIRENMIDLQEIQKSLGF